MNRTLDSPRNHEVESGRVRPRSSLPICPFCFSSTARETLRVKEMAKGTRDVFQFAICSDCGSAYITDFPKNISEYYEDYYSFNNDALTLEKLWWKRAIVSAYAKLVVRGGFSFLFRPFFRCPSPRQMRVLSPNLQAFLFIGAKAKARILDVGSGIGQFVRMMRKFGYANAIGIDPFVAESSECPYIRRSDIQTVKGTYDVILFNHSLEHMTDPEAAVRKCTELLAPGGMVVIQIPNVHSREFARFKQDWCWLHAPYHFALPSRKGIELMAGRSGFRVTDAIGTSRYDHYLYSDEYARDISNKDTISVRRRLEDEIFDKKSWLSLSKLAHSLNKTLAGDWIAYYLVRN